jgi:probable rRNA maturation factor
LPQLGSSSTKTRVPVEIIVQGGPYRGVSSAEVRRRAEAMMAQLQLKKSFLSIVLTDDESIRVLNRDYRRKDKPTDVLAFPMREGRFAGLARELLGDVVISIPTAERQARERGAAPLAEVTMLLAHGLLHLLGWDHDTAAKDRAMRAETDRLCAVADVRAPRRARSAPARRAPGERGKPASRRAQRPQQKKR